MVGTSKQANECINRTEVTAATAATARHRQGASFVIVSSNLKQNSLPHRSHHRQKMGEGTRRLNCRLIIKSINPTLTPTDQVK